MKIMGKRAFWKTDPVRTDKKMFMNSSQWMRITQILFAMALIFVGPIMVEFSPAQTPTKEMTQREKTKESKEKKLESRSERNPFLLPPGTYPLSKGAPAHREGTSKPDTRSVETDPYKVKAILISDHIQLASIGQTIVTVGDRLNDEKVLEIKSDRVILGKGDKKRTLLLYQSPVKLTVEEK